VKTLNYFLKKLRESGSTGRKPGSVMQQTIIDDAIDEWRARLRACVRAKGGTLNNGSRMFCSPWFIFFHFVVSYACKKTGNNDDFIAHLIVTFTRCCLQVISVSKVLAKLLQKQNGAIFFNTV